MKNIFKFPATTSASGASKSWQTLHQQFVSYGRNAKEWLRKCILLLPQIEKQQIWRKKRFKDIYEYAAKLAGMSRDQVNDALRILRKVEELPALRQVIEEKGINAVRPIVNIANKENQQFWAEKASAMPKSLLETYVRHFRKGEVGGLEVSELGGHLPGENLQITGCTSTASQSVNLQKVTIAMQLEPAVADEFNKIKGESDWNQTIKELLQLRREKLEAKKPETVVVKQKSYTSRKEPAAIKKYVLAKTNSTCAFPGCTKPCRTIHHAERFALSQKHDPDTLVPLCQEHHDLAHLGLIENEEKPPQFWKIRSYPDKNNPKYQIDQAVQKYRSTA